MSKARRLMIILIALAVACCALGEAAQAQVVAFGASNV
jgi:hypothetical protein